MSLSAAYALRRRLGTKSKGDMQSLKEKIKAPAIPERSIVEAIMEKRMAKGGLVEEEEPTEDFLESSDEPIDYESELHVDEEPKPLVDKSKILQGIMSKRQR